MPRHEIHGMASAFSHWVVVTLFIAYMSTPLPRWLQGMVVSVLASVPALIGYSKTNPQCVLPILAFRSVRPHASGADYLAPTFLFFSDECRGFRRGVGYRIYGEIGQALLGFGATQRFDHRDV